VLDHAWPTVGDDIVAIVHGVRSPSRRRHSLVAQLGAEAAGLGGDANACQALIDHAAEHGLFDLHWLDRCPALDVGRNTPSWDRTHIRVKRVADTVLDALYGDHAVGTVLSDTVLRTPVTRR